MKKIFYGIGFLIISSFVSQTFAADFNGDVCKPEFKAPASCWEKQGTSIQKKNNDSNCDSGNLNKTRQKDFFKSFGEYKTYLQGRKEDTLSDTSKKLIAWTVPTDAQVDSDSSVTMKELQELIQDQYKGGSFDDEKITCKYEDHGRDGFYGLCTQYAFEKFLDLVPKDCIEPSLTVTPSTRCRIEIKFVSTIFSTAKLQKQEAAKKAKAETPPRTISAATELEKEIGARLGKTINFVFLGGNKFYFDVGNGNATNFKEKTEAVLRDEDFLKKTENIDAETSHPYSEFVEGVSVEKKHCVFDVLENVDIGGLRPRYLVGASDGTRNLSGSVHDITYWFQRFGRKIVGFIAAIAVFFIVWNAFGMVMSMGDADKISSSKKAIQWILIGLALAIFAYVIIKTIISLTYLSTVDYVEPSSISTEK